MDVNALSAYDALIKVLSGEIKMVCQVHQLNVTSNQIEYLYTVGNIPVTSDLWWRCALAELDALVTKAASE